MSTLSSPKEWVTLAEAARHMSEIFAEEVTETDMLQLAVDGELVLSIDLIDGAAARRCAPTASGADVVRLSGIWDLPVMPGAAEAASIALNASFVEGRDGDLFQLLGPADFLERRALVVRVSELYTLYQSTLGISAPDTRGTRHRDALTHLHIIGGLLSLLQASSPFASQAAVIDALLARHRGKPGISAPTLEAAFAEGRRLFDAS